MKRYNKDGFHTEHDEGAFVLYEDARNEVQKLQRKLTESRAKEKMDAEIISDKLSYIERLETFIKERLSRCVTQDLIVDALRKNTTAEELLENENAELRARLDKTEAQRDDLADFASEFIDAWESGVGGDSYLLRYAHETLTKLDDNE